VAVRQAGLSETVSLPALSSLPEIVIEPPRGWISLGLKDFFEHRELLYFLMWRDIKIRYKQTVLGAGWAVLQPLLTMVIFSLFFGKLGKMPSDGVPYPIFSFAALVPWHFFAHGLTQSANSLVTSANMIRKVYFPRALMPTAAALAGLVDFVIAFGVLCCLMPIWGLAPDWRILWIPLLLLLAVTTTLGAGLWLAALNTQFRDIRYTLPFITQFWMFATPIAYPSSLLEQPWRSIYGLNPMVGVVEGFRWAMLDSSPSPGFVMVASVMSALVLFVSGLIYFRRMEDSFADVV